MAKLFEPQFISGKQWRLYGLLLEVPQLQPSTIFVLDLEEPNVSTRQQRGI